MKIIELLNQDKVIESLGGSEKKEALAEMCEVLCDVHPEISKEALLNVLLDREKLGSTGIGEGVAIPHGKVRGLNTLVALFARSEEGLDFDAIDGQPVYLLFLLVAPDDSVGTHLKALARVSRLLKAQEIRQRLREADSRSALYGIIQEADSKL